MDDFDGAEEWVTVAICVAFAVWVVCMLLLWIEC